MTLRTWADACREFRWAESLAAMGWAGADPVNLGHTILDRHAGRGRLALRWLGQDGTRRAWTYDELAELSSRVAGVLAARGVGPGDRVAGYLPRVPETLAAMVGTWKAGAVWVPIFTGFGADAIAYRLAHSGARVLVTHRAWRARLPRPVAAGTVLVVGGGGEPGDLDFATEVARQPAAFAPVPRHRADPAVLLYTSGSTGPPKGVQIATNFPVAVHPWMAYGVDLRPDDVFWPTGDPGWGYGLVCYMVALALGAAVICQEAAPAPEDFLQRLADLGVTALATTPTLLRAVMALGPAAVGAHRVRLRSANSCGEPLNAEVIEFFRRQWGVTVMDQYGSSEVGLPIGNANGFAMTVKPGSMGLPFPGAEAAIVDDEGREVEPGTVGQIALRPSAEGYYSLGYWRDPERTAALARSGWIVIGDLGRRDGEGYFWFEGRADDVIKSAGYRIGPFEVESAILRHPAVAEAAVVGKPDALRGQLVKAFVVLRAGVAPSAALEAEIVETVRTHLGRPQAPREVAFVASLPKTETGKIQRFLLRRSA